MIYGYKTLPRYVLYYYNGTVQDIIITVSLQLSSTYPVSPDKYWIISVWLVAPNLFFAVVDKF